MQVKIDTVEVKDVGTISVQLQYTVTAYTVHPDFQGEQIKIVLTSDKNETFDSIRSKVKTIAGAMWAKLMKD